jgi:hypothetical protein
MDVWCGARAADTTQKKTGMHPRPPVGGGVRRTERNEKTSSNVVVGGVLSVDKSLLMGVLPILAVKCHRVHDHPPRGQARRSSPCSPRAGSRGYPETNRVVSAMQTLQFITICSASTLAEARCMPYTPLCPGVSGPTDSIVSTRRSIRTRAFSVSPDLRVWWQAS